MIIKGLFGQRFIEKLYILGNNKLKLKNVFSNNDGWNVESNNHNITTIFIAPL